MTTLQIKRVLFVDPSFLSYQGLDAILAATTYQIVARTQDQSSAIAVCQTEEIDIALIGQSFGPRASLELVRALHEHFPHLKILLWHEHAENALFQEDAFRAGAGACLQLSVRRDDILAALEAVSQGARLYSPDILAQTTKAPHLTARQVEVLKQVAEGKTDKEIAQMLYLSVHTVRNQMAKILEKLEVSDREAAVWRAKHQGLI